MKEPRPATEWGSIAFDVVQQMGCKIYHCSRRPFEGILTLQRKSIALLLITLCSLGTIWITLNVIITKSLRKNQINGLPSLFFQLTPDKIINKPEKPLCILPKLDPYAPDIMKYVSKVSKPKCGGKRIAKYMAGKLVVRESNILDVILYPIQRPSGDDFNAIYGDCVSVTHHPITPLSSGHFGCLAISKNNLEYIIVPSPNGKRAVLEQSSCYNAGIFEIMGDKVKRLKHVMTSKYLSVSGNETTLESPSETLNQQFEFTSLQKILVHRQGTCLKLIPSDLKVASANCTSADPIIFRDTSPQDFVPVKIPPSNGFLLQILVGSELHSEYHLLASRKEVKTKSARKINKDMPENIILLMYDSMSASNFVRQLPKTTKILRDNPASLEFKGHTIVGDGTTAQLCAILTGIDEADLPEARRSMPHSKTVDRWPWIFKDLANIGYATLFSEDDPHVSTFNYRLHGFKNSPTLHYGRPFWLKAAGSVAYNMCIRNRITHDYHLEYLSSFLDAHDDHSKAALIITSSITHNNLNNINMLDDDLSSFVDRFISSEAGNKSALIIFGDHGLRSGVIRNTPQGKLEERLPYFSITLPSWFPRKQAVRFKNAIQNSKILTSHFDVYHTLRDIAGLDPVKRNYSETGLSLFDSISSSKRSCSNAGVEPHWCPCMNLVPIQLESNETKRYAKGVVRHINNLLEAFPQSKSLCASLELDAVFEAARGILNDRVQRFLGTEKNQRCDSCRVVLDMHPRKKSPSFFYQLTLRVLPSLAIFEASFSVKSSNELVDITISRTNLYGSQPSCVQKDLPHLRKYCYCSKHKS